MEIYQAGRKSLHDTEFWRIFTPTANKSEGEHQS